MPIRKGYKPQKRQVTETTRRCRNCEIVKHVDEFYGFIRRDRPGRPDKKYYFSDCKPCHQERCRKDSYGMTLAEIVAEQGSDICPLCKKRIATCLDHDHRTGLARGALCRKCNLIMHYMDDPGWVKRAEKYLARQK